MLVWLALLGVYGDTPRAVAMGMLASGQAWQYALLVDAIEDAGGRC